MSANLGLVSIIIPVCNQGDEARQTVASAREALGDVPHEIVLVDDQSIDGSCHGMPKDVVIVRSERRNGVSSARRLGFQHSRGELLIWSDPHCRFPKGSLRHLAKVASHKHAIVQPKCVPDENARARYGGKLSVGERGLRVARAWNRPDKSPALYGTIYAVKRCLYEHLGGWPELPGIWGYSEQALTLMCWFAGITVHVDPAYTCVHKSVHPDGRFPFSVRLRDQARNAHYVHAAFFPKTYDTRWKPILEQRFGRRGEHVAPLQTDRFRRLRRHIRRASVRTEEQFFAEILGEEVSSAVEAMSGDTRLIEQQRRRSKPGEFKTVRPRVDLALAWMKASLENGGLTGIRALDLGTRDGYGLEALGRLGCSHVEGVELVPETAQYAARRGRRVRQGDMQQLADADESWELVTSIHSLEHCDKPQLALNEMVRVLRPGGSLFLVVPREKEPNGRAAHNCAFGTMESFREFVLSNAALDSQSLRDSVGVLARGCRELRVLIKKL